MASREKQVCIVGAGVIGLSVATHLQETFPNVVITLIADRFTPNTLASDRAGGLFMPPMIDHVAPGDMPKARQWLSGSLKHFDKLYNSEGGGKVGLNFVSGYYVKPTGEEAEEGPTWWKDLVTGYRNLDEDEMKWLSYFKEKETIHCGTYIINGREYLPWLMNKFIKSGGITVKKKIHSLFELHSFDIIVNCTGLGARELVNDSKLYPTRGQLVSVKAPWIKQWIDEIGHIPRRVYIFPRPNDVILGATNEKDNEDLDTDPVEIQRIINRCQTVMPSLANAEIQESWAGVRPMRKGGVRLEKEEPPPGVIRHPIIIHCYGHGSYGISLSWGCAEEVVGIIRQCIYKSKL